VALTGRTIAWYDGSMFLNHNDWPPAPSGFEPKPTRPLDAAQERLVMRVIAILLLAMFLGPFAGSSLIEAMIALVRSTAAL
jgi:hypothetical protein